MAIGKTATSLAPTARTTRDDRDLRRQCAGVKTLRQATDGLGKIVVMLVDEVAEKGDCIFCQLIARAPARWVAQEDLAVAFSPRPQGQLAEGHTLVAPRLHCEGVLDAPAEELQATTALVQRVGRAMQQALGASGVVVLNASGPASG